MYRIKLTDMISEFFHYLASVDTPEICQNGLPKVGKTSRTALWSSLALKNMVVQGAAASLQHFIANSMELPLPMFHVHRHHNLLSSPMHAHSDISCCLPGFWMTAAFSSTPPSMGPGRHQSKSG
jgi:hypothetical protein